MSEKHLTELPWKTLAIKQGVKDLGLGKALAAYGNIDVTKDPAKALEGLQQIGELAVKLKKANSKNEDVVAHLDEVVKEVKKTTPSLELRVKSATAAAVPAKAPTEAPAKPGATAKPTEDEDEEKEAAAFKKDLKQQMVSALAQVKARTPGDPEQQKEPKPQLQFMACLGAKNSSVIVARKVGGATKKLLLEIAGGASGGKFVQGECIFEKNSHTFVVTEVPGGLAKKLAAALQSETGQKYKVRVRNTDGSVSLDSDTDVDPEAGAADPMGLFKARFAALLPRVKEAVAAGLPTAQEIKLKASEAGVFANKKDFAQANQCLDAVEAMLKNAGSAKPAPSAARTREAAAICLKIWIDAKEAADIGLSRLQSALKGANDPAFLRIAERGVYGVSQGLQAGLLVALQELARQADPGVDAAQKLRLQVTEFRRFLATDPAIQLCDENPFEVAVELRSILGAALKQLDQQLTAVGG